MTTATLAAALAVSASAAPSQQQQTPMQEITLQVPAFVLTAFIQKWEEDTADSRRYGFKIFTFDEWSIERMKDVAFSHWRQIAAEEQH